MSTYGEYASCLGSDDPCPDRVLVYDIAEARQALRPRAATGELKLKALTVQGKRYSWTELVRELGDYQSPDPRVFHRWSIYVAYRLRAA